MLPKIIINTSNLKKGGALQVAESFVWEASKISGVRFFVILGAAASTVIKPETYKACPQLQFIRVDFQPTHSVFNFFRFRTRLSQIEKQIQPDGVITVFGTCYWKPNAPHIMGFANGYLLYEDSYFFKVWQGWKSLRYQLQKYLRRYLLKTEADFYWTETEDSKMRLAAFLNKPPDRIVVSSNNCSHVFRSGDYEVLDRLPSKKSVRLLYISSYYAHKGFELIPGILEKLEAAGLETELVVTLKPEDFSRIFKNSKQVVNLEPVPPKYCPYLYQQSDIVFAPTLLETFSAVYPEAMYMQKPIVTTDLPFARSICGDAALYFDPASAADAANKIEQLINDIGLRDKLIANGLERLKMFDLPEERFRKILNRLVGQDPSASR